MTEDLDAAELESLLLKEVLPEIERTIALQKGQKLRDESIKILAEQVSNMQDQAEQQYQEVLNELRNQAERAVSSKRLQLQAQSSQLENLINEAKRRLRQKQLQEHQQRFLTENFTEEVMAHPYFQQMRETVLSEIKGQFDDKYEQEFARKEKELLIKLKQREDKDFAELEQQHRAGCNQQVLQLQTRLDSAKVELARLRSDSNVKTKKIQAERKQYQDKLEKDAVNYQKIVEGLQQQLRTMEEASRQSSKMQAEQLIDSDRNYYQMEVTEQQQQEEVLLPPPPRPHIPQKMIQSSCSDQQPSVEDLGLLYPSRHRILDISPSEYVQKMLENRYSSANNIPCSHSTSNQHPLSLEQTFEQRDLSKYLPTEAESRRREYRSNFREEYERQLRRLSGKRSRLSATAKQIITQNVLRFSEEDKRRSTSIFSAIR